MYYGEVFILNKEVILNIDCGFQLSIKEKYGYLNINYIYVCYCIYYENNLYF